MSSRFVLQKVHSSCARYYISMHLGQVHGWTLAKGNPVLCVSLGTSYLQIFSSAVRWKLGQGTHLLSEIFPRETHFQNKNSHFSQEEYSNLCRCTGTNMPWNSGSFETNDNLQMSQPNASSMVKFPTQFEFKTGKWKASPENWNLEFKK